MEVMNHYMVHPKLIQHCVSYARIKIQYSTEQYNITQDKTTRNDLVQPSCLAQGGTEAKRREGTSAVMEDGSGLRAPETHASLLTALCGGGRAGGLPWFIYSHRVRTSKPHSPDRHEVVSATFRTSQVCLAHSHGGITEGLGRLWGAGP